jgi:hypothetical protein
MSRDQINERAVLPITRSPDLPIRQLRCGGAPVRLRITNLSYLRGGAPGPLFLTLGLREPRGSVRFGLGGRFSRAARFSFLRSALSLMFFVFINVVSAPFFQHPATPFPTKRIVP